MASDEEVRDLKHCIGYGIVSSVNKDEMTARVKIDSRGFVTGDLHVLQNTPLVTVVNRDLTTELTKWEYEAQYVTHNRELNMGETYKKEYPDRIYTWWEQNGIITKDQTIKIYPWLPYVGQMVVCLFVPDGDGDGFILGGI